jgi:hypothetical protein
MPIWKDQQGGLHDDADGTALTLPSWPQGMTLAADEEIAAARAPTAQQVQAAMQSSAKDALAASDIVVLRCYEHGIAVPDEWVTYRATLRPIAGGADTTSTVLPTAPTDYPANT